MKCKILSVLFVLALSITSLLAQQTPEFEAQFKLGNQLIEQKDYDGAIRAYSECIRLSPKQSVCYGNRAIAYRDRSNLSQSIADFTEAIKLAPNSAKHYNGRAISYTNQDLFDLAIADLKTSLKINPEDADVKKYLEQVTELALKIRQYEALKGLSDAMQKAPGNTLTADDYYKRGKEQAEKEGVVESVAAIESFDQCLRLNPEFADCYFQRGQVYKQLRQYEQAAKDFTQAINLESSILTKKVYYNARAYVYGNELKNYEASIADYTELIKFDPKNWIAYASRGYFHLKNKNYDKAVADYTEALKLDADVNVSNYKYRAQAYCALGKKALALADEKKVTEAGATLESACQPIP